MNLKKGYVKNKTHLWAHTMKRSVGPGAKIPLSDLYDQYGAKHDLKADEEFVLWLRDVKLRDRNKWQIFMEDNKPFEEISEKKETKEEPEVQGSTVVKTDKSRGENVAPPVVKDMEVADVVGLTVRKAREVISRIHDIKLLKYAVAEANQLSDKDSLCIILRRRILELETSVRR